MDNDEMAKIREELHQFINVADEQTLELIYAIMRPSNDLLLTEEQERDLQLRIQEHKTGLSKSYTWAEARAIIEQRQKRQ
jgi:hypothetical protein